MENLYNFRSVPMVTTFIHAASSRSLAAWRLLERASTADMGIRLAKLEHHSLKKGCYIVRDGSRFMFTFLFIGYLNKGTDWMLEDCPETSESPLNSARLSEARR